MLSNRAVQGDHERPWRCRRIARQQVSLFGRPRKRRTPFRFPRDVSGKSLLLPSTASDIRTAFDMICEQADVRYAVMAEVDDMAMLRLLARDTGALALLPSVVVRDELRSRQLAEYCVVPGLYEQFYAITVKRSYLPPLLKTLFARSEKEVLAMGGTRARPQQRDAAAAE